MVVGHRDSCTKYMGWIGHISEKYQSFLGPSHIILWASLRFHHVSTLQKQQHLASPRSLVKNSLIDAQMEKADVPVMFQSDGTRMGFLDWPEFWHLPLEKTERPCGLLSTSFDPFASLRLASGQGSPAEARAQCCKKCDFHSEWTRPAAAPLRSLTLEADHLKFRRSTN